MWWVSQIIIILFFLISRGFCQKYREKSEVIKIFSIKNKKVMGRISFGYSFIVARKKAETKGKYSGRKTFFSSLVRILKKTYSISSLFLSAFSAQRAVSRAKIYVLWKFIRYGARVVQFRDLWSQNIDLWLLPDIRIGRGVWTFFKVSSGAWPQQLLLLYVICI